MTESWGGDPVVSGGAGQHSDWGNDPVIVKSPTGVPPPSAPSPGIGGPSPRAQAMSETMFGTGVGQQQAFTSQQDIEKSLRAAGKSDAEIQADPTWQSAARGVNRSVSAGGTSMALGAMGGGAAGKLAGAGMRAIAPTIGRVTSEAMPGAAQKALGSVSKVGPVTDRSVLGSRMMKDLRPNYDASFAQRAQELERVAPSNKYITADEKERGALNALRRKVYNDPKYAELKKFEDSALGKQVVADTTNYSNVPKLDPFNLPPKAFKSAQTVSDLKDLLSGAYANPQDAVESFAGEHAAQSLYEVTRGKDIGQAASAAEQWVVKNRAWLNETPVTKALAEHYVDQLKSVAKTQSVSAPIAQWSMRGAAGALGLGGVLKLLGH